MKAYKLISTFGIATETMFLSNWENPLRAKMIPSTILNFLDDKNNRPNVVIVFKDYGMISNFSRN